MRTWLLGRNLFLSFFWDKATFRYIKPFWKLRQPGPVKPPPAPTLLRSAEDVYGIGLPILAPELRWHQRLLQHMFSSWGQMHSEHDVGRMRRGWLVGVWLVLARVFMVIGSDFQGVRHFFNVTLKLEMHFLPCKFSWMNTRRYMCLWHQGDWTSFILFSEATELGFPFDPSPKSHRFSMSRLSRRLSEQRKEAQDADLSSRTRGLEWREM